MKVNRLDKQNKLKNKQLQKLQLKIDNQTNQARIFEKIEADAKNNDPKATFLLDQILNYNKQKSRWSEVTVRSCIAWRISSPKGYNYGKASILKLPSRSTLERYIGNGQDVTGLIEARLKAEAEVLQPVERICSLIVDDMSIKEKLCYSRTEDKFYGLETTNESSQTIGKKPTLANKMLCYVVHGMTTKYTIPAGYFFHRTLKNIDFVNLTLKVMKLLHNCGFTVLRIVTDNHKSNVALFKSLSSSNNLMTHIQHPIEPTIPLFMSFDYCHIIKNLRNIFLDHDMHSGNGIISARFLKKIYDMQHKLIVKPVKFLTRKHICPTNLEKMNVRRAVQVFSIEVRAAIEYLGKYNNPGFVDVEETLKFMEMMHTFFKIHDVNDKTQHIRQLNENSAPYTDINDERLLWMLKTLPAYIDSIQLSSKANKMTGLTKETAEAVKFTAKSTAECIKYLLEESGFFYVLTRAFSSDAVESMFSNVRLCGGSQDATDARAAHYAIKRIIKSGLVTTSESANVYSDCNHLSKIGQIQSSERSTTETNIHIPDSIIEEISDLHKLTFVNTIFTDINSASVAFLSGYICRTIEERLECKNCLDSLLTTAKSTPLLDLIYLQDRGKLKYPTRSFTNFINKIIKITFDILEHIPVNHHPRTVVESLLLEPIASSAFLPCEDKNHKVMVANLILSKVLKPIFANFGYTRTENVTLFSNLTHKPHSRKVLKL